MVVDILKHEFQTSWLLLLCLVCGVFGGCDDQSLSNCVRQLITYERQVGDGNITYTESELDELCRLVTLLLLLAAEADLAGHRLILK